VEIQERIPPGGQFTTTYTLTGAQAGRGFYIIPKPEDNLVREYRVIVTRTGQTTPMPPSEPDTYNPAAIDFGIYRPNIIPESIKTNADNVPTPTQLTINFDWRAFTRKPYNDRDVPVDLNGTFVDTNVLYDIWVTDSFNTLHNPGVAPVVGTLGPHLRVKPNQTNPYVYVTSDNGGTITRYVTEISPGVFEERPLDPNKIYYIRIEGRMADKERNVSLPSYGSIYIPPLDGVDTNPIMLTSPPLEVIKSETTTESITIEWDTRWYEIFDEATGVWHSKAWILNGDLHFSRPANDSAQQILPLKYSFDEDTVGHNFVSDAHFPSAGLNRLGSLVPGGTVIRHMELDRSAQYVVHTTNFNTVANNTLPGSEVDPFRAYINDIIGQNLPQNANRPINEWVPPANTWTAPISASGAYPTFRHTVTTRQNPAGPLEANTPYLVFLRPVLSSGAGELLSYYPTYVGETTKHNEGE
jgi:hypothetical protein